jgi:fructan beta-fructosidase
LRFESRIGEFFECPDLFELAVGGDAKKTKWVLYAADGHYVLGDFDGKRFTAEPGRHRLWHGPFYAAQTFSNAPGGRRIQIGWAQIEFPGMPFNQQMTIPVDLRLRTTADGVRMFAQPVAEVEKLRGRKVEAVGGAWQTVTAGKPLATGADGELLDIRATLRPSGARRCGIIARGIPIAYDTKERALTCGKVTAPLTLDGGTLHLRVLVDRGSVEVFANDGRVAVIAAVTPQGDSTAVTLFADGGDMAVRNASVAFLRSAWFDE